MNKQFKYQASYLHRQLIKNGILKIKKKSLI